MLLVIALLMVLTAVTVALAPSPPGTRGTAQTGSPTPAPEAAEPTPAPSAQQPAPAGGQASPRERDPVAPGESPLQTMRADATGQVIRVEPGDQLRLRVISDGLETVQLGVDGPIEVVDADSPAEFEVLAEEDLDAEVRLLESGQTIGRVTAQP
jgi:hypothetical protein